MNLHQQVGPLPLSAWLGVAAVGTGIGIYLRHRQTVAATPAPAVDTTQLPPIDPGNMVPGVGADAGGTDTGNTGNDAGPIVLDNEGWRVKAEAAMMLAGKNPITVEQALSDYLDGNRLSDAEAQIITAVLREVGPPPYSAPRPLYTPKVAPVIRRPHSPSSTHPILIATPRTYHVVVGDTLNSVAARLHVTPQALYQANSRVIHTDHKLHHGMVLRVP